MQFQDELAAGTVLVRPALQSPDYVAGVSGWAVKQDGSAEFNDVEIRGGTTVGGVGLYYRGTPAHGNLFLSIAGASGTDEFGNFYQAGVTVYDSSGATVQLAASAGAGASVNLQPPSVAGVTWESGYLDVNSSSRLGTNTPTLAVQAPQNAAGLGSGAGIQLYGAPQSLTPGAPLSEAVVSAARTTLASDLQVLGDVTSLRTGTWTPVLSGAGSPSVSQAVGQYVRLGPLVVMRAYLVLSSAGSGTASVGLSAPLSIDRTTRQVMKAHLAGVTGGQGSGEYTALCLMGGSGATIDRITRAGVDLTGANLSSSAIITVEGVYFTNA